MVKTFLLVIVAIYSVVAAPSADDNLVIQLPDGKIRGSTYVTQNNVPYYGWRKIPYAKPPLGNLRFQAPQPPTPWSGILDTIDEPASCIASLPSGESEDCLYINVYTPTPKPEKKLPVLFWIYGGGFIKGNSSKSKYGPDFLIEEDVIVVSFNYRVNSFGFLSTGDAVLPGNAGLKDQRLALRWTYNNIELFGGDREKITIAGQSSGGASVGLLLASSSTAGLYRAAIAQSGSALVHWTNQQDPRSVAFKIADKIGGGSYGNDSEKVVKFLQERSIQEIIVATLTIDSPSALGEVTIWPVTEVDHEDAFLTESQYVLLESGRFNQVPLVTGICAAEALRFINNLGNVANYVNLIDSDPSVLVPYDLRPNSNDVPAASEAIRNIYFAENKSVGDNVGGLVEYLSDKVFAKGVIKHAELAAKHVPVYLYQFAHGGPAPFPVDDYYETAGHGSELAYLFYNGAPNNEPTYVLFQKRMVKLWSNFIKFLNPTPETSELLDNITWPTLSSAESQYLNINLTMSVQSGLKQPHFAGWNQVYEKYGKKPFVTF